MRHLQENPKLSEKATDIAMDDATTKHTARSRPFTPVRRFWNDILRPLKRTRTETAPVPAHGKRARIALQTEDADNDAIVITALHSLPFCCHADLRAMPRPALHDVARRLNAHLPAALRINTDGSNDRDEDVRKQIEILVGIRRAVPGAPKAVKMHARVDDADGSARLSPRPAIAQSPETSLVSNRSRSQDMYGIVRSPPLTRLVEETDSEDVGMIAPSPVRPAKRRRIIDEPESPTPIRRARSDYATRSRVNGPQTRVAQRSASATMANERDVVHNVIDTAFITTTRPRYRFRRRTQVIGRTSTPKKASMIDSVTGDDEGDGERAIKRKKTAEVVMDIDESEMTFGIRGMSMTIGETDTDVGMD